MINETAKSTLLIDGKQAEDELKRLTNESKKYREEMKRCELANDKAGFDKAKAGYEANQKAIKGLKTELFSLEKVMNNLSGASMNQLKKAQKEITFELNKMTRGTEEYIAKSRELSLVNNEIARVGKELKGTSGAAVTLWDKMSAGATKFMAAATVVWGVIKGGKFIIESSQSLADKWAESLGGAKAGILAIAQSISNWDFKHFFSNIENAISKGKELARMRDELEDSLRSQTVLEAKYKFEISQLKLINATQTNSIEVRKKALEDAIIKEKELNEIKLKNAQLAYDINMSDMLLQTKLFVKNDKLTEEENKQLEQQGKKKLENFFLEFNRNKELQDQVQEYITLKTKYEEMSKPKPGDSGSFSGYKTKEQLEEIKRRRDIVTQMEVQIDQTAEDVKVYASILDAYGKAADPTIDAFIESFAKLYQVRQELNDDSLKLVKGETNLEKKLLKEKVDVNGTILGLLIEETEKAYQQMRLSILQFQNKYNIDDESAKQALLGNEIAYLQKKAELIALSGNDATQAQIEVSVKQKELDDSIAVSKQNNIDKLKQTDKEYYDVQEESAKNQTKIIKAELDKQKEAEEKADKEKKDRQNSYWNITQNAAVQMGQLMGEFATNAEMSQKEYNKRMTLLALDALEQAVQVAVVETYVKQLAGKGFLGIVTAAAITGMIYAAFATVKGKVGQHFSGRYDVIGEDDGQHYSAPYAGQAKTGVYHGPVLVAEHGNELIVDNGTLRNLQVNFPDVVPKIMASKVPQQAEGNVSKLASSTIEFSNKTLERNLAAQTVLLARLNRQLEKGIAADISYSNLKDKLDKGAAAENRGSRT